MTFRAVRRRVRSAGRLLALTALLVGCGKSGPPLPPLPSGPLPPTEIEPRQLGRRAFVEFRVSAARRPGPAGEPVETELVRVSIPPGPAPPPDADAFRRRGVLVGRVAGDPLPIGASMLVEDRTLDELAGGPAGWTLRYALRVRDRRGRPSALVMARDLVPVEPGAAPRQLVAEPTVDGIRLRWAAPDVAATAFNVYRVSADEATTRVPTRALNSSPLDATSYLDPSVVTGERYRYTVRTVLAAARPWREGPPSEPYDVLAEDRFPPDAPDGLVVVQEGPFVRLFWDPNDEDDLAAYHVYRRDEGGDWRRVTAAPETQPRFLDRDVRPDTRYVYRVSAVDRASPPNESRVSESVELEVLVDPDGGVR